MAKKPGFTQRFVEIVFDFLSYLLFGVILVAIAYGAILIFHRHQYKLALLLLLVILVLIMLEIGCALIAVRGDKKRLKWKIIDNIFVNFLPPW